MACRNPRWRVDWRSGCALPAEPERGDARRGGRIVGECRPVVATAVRGLPDVIIDGENGQLTEPGDSAALAGALRGALSATWDRARIVRSVANMTWMSLAQANVGSIKESERNQSHVRR